MSIKDANMIGASVKIKRSAHPYAKIQWKKASQLFERLPVQEKDQGTRPAMKEILHFLAAVGVVGMVIAFPPIITGVAAFVRLGKRDYRSWGMRRALHQLAKQHYVTIKVLPDGSTTVRITKQGMMRALSYQVNSMQIFPQKKWDGRWRVVIFDIEEKHRRLRDIFRMRLVQLGLFRLQESVFVSPYPCFDEIEFLRELYGVAFSAKYLLVQNIEDDQVLRSHFELPTS